MADILSNSAGFLISLFLQILEFRRPQDLFRKAIAHPGQPEDFALQTVQEAIKPQVVPPEFLLSICTSSPF